MITSMAFVPPQDLLRVFAELWELMPLELEPVMLYFEKNYIGTETRRGNRNVLVEPKFEHSLWNLYNRTLDGISTCNSCMECGTTKFL
uniref:Uncharacterized protein n=1 Tax=Ditylenchus dipsaci TaxID=166011 RepID=A0A915CY66_9BILA